MLRIDKFDIREVLDIEVKLVGELTCKCLGCGAKYKFDVNSLDEERYVNERPMDDEVEYVYTSELQCEDCGNRMYFTIRIFEYPIGAINDYDEETYGCEILKLPEIAVCYYDADFDYYEETAIRKQVNGSYFHLEKILRDKEAIYDITPREFEELVACVFERQGYNVEVTPITRDGGCDIIATKDISGIPYMILIECKKYSARHKVDVQLVRSLLGVQSDKKANKAILVTSSLFTSDARQFAARQEHLISLVDVNDLINMMKNIR